MNGRSVTAAVLAAASALAAPASAQGVITDAIGSTMGNFNRGGGGPGSGCLSGDPLSARQFQRVRTRSHAAMQAYLALAGASESADVTSTFVRDEIKRSWVSGGTSVPVNAVNDPLARALAAGAARLAEPTFIAAGNGRSAQVVWPLISSDGERRLGHYRLDLRRESRAFRITRLELIEGPTEPAPIRQYCQDPGDVEEFLADRQRRELELAAGTPPEPAGRPLEPGEGGDASVTPEGSEPD